MEKRLLSVLLAVIMVVTLMPTMVFAADYIDTQGHWGEQAINRWSGYGVVEGKGNGIFDPDGFMTRAEATQVFANLFKLEAKADLQDYTDVGFGDWYDAPIAKCISAGIIEGYGDGIIDPNGTITREMFFVMFCRALGIKAVGTAEKNISDALDILDYAKGYINALVNKGYIQGTTSSEDGIIVEPKQNINRASAMSLMDKTIKTYVDTIEKITAGDGLTLIVVDNANVTFDKSTKNAEVYVFGKNVTITNAPVGTVVTTSNEASGTNVNGKSFSKNTTTIVKRSKPSGGGSYIPPAPAKTFKAVYDQTDDANVLTFYYDSSNHDADGATIILYDNLTIEATEKDNWGYDNIRDDIKSVVFNESLKGFDGLKSTAFMLSEMWDAQAISGAENLVTKNVTNMSYMFYDFGMDNNNIASVPAVGAWDTSKVTNMSNMFKGYGQGSSKINGTPDVSNWNTENVTDMSNMFDSYCQKTTAVPDVSQWDTGNVKDMSYMFYSYGNQSQTLNAVPDVSSWNTENVITMSGMFMNFGNASETLSTVPAVGSWNTGNVADMKDMFKYYGPYESSGSRVTFGVLNIVPDVSNWDTRSVADMSNLFYGYGYCSDVLNAVPDVSNWNTENVVTMSGLFCAYGKNSSVLNAVPVVSNWNTKNVEDMNSIFSGYGYYSTCLDFTLDLASWNIFNVIDCSSAFDIAGYNATDWVVTIPAVTILTSGEAIENAPNKWYLSDGTNGISPDTSTSRAFNLNIEEGDTLYYIYSQGLFVSNTLRYTYASGAYSIKDLFAVPLVLGNYSNGDWVHSLESGKYVKCTNNHGIALPALYEITLAGNNVTCVTTITPLKVPEGTTYKVENGYLSLTYNGKVISSEAAIITPNIGYEVITQSGIITTDTSITIETKCVNTDNLYYITNISEPDYWADVYEWNGSAYVYTKQAIDHTGQTIVKNSYYHFNNGILTPCTDAETIHVINVVE